MHSITRRAVIGAPAVAAALGGSFRGSAARAQPASGKPEGRRAEAFQVRVDAAQFHKDLPLPEQAHNGDEQLFPSRIANFSKGLPHDFAGEVDINAYYALLAAIASGRAADFETIPSGCPDPNGRLKLVNPLAGLAFEMEGADSHHLAMPPAPRFGSPQVAAEMVELYWQALARDVPFSEYPDSPITLSAASELSRLAGFRGPRAAGVVTPQTLFRGFTTADLRGPYVSQFLLRTVPFGSQFVEPRLRTTEAGAEYLTEFDHWLAVQNGYPPRAVERFDPVRRYIRNGRDLAAWVHRDVLFQAYFNACLILITPPDAQDKLSSGIGAPFSRSNPYQASAVQAGFGTFGAPYATTMVAEAATRALKAVWYQKWFVHRRLRPEEYGGRVHALISGRSLEYPIPPDLLNAAALGEIYSRYGSYLLPQAYPEGAPLHPAYGAGHATVAGACVTMLKALFDESFVIAEPVVAGPAGLSLVPYVGPDAERLTVGGELNKLAANVALARNFAGIHWRSDYAQSVRLGEAVAISVLHDHKRTFAEDFLEFSFTSFDGETIVI